MKEASLAAFKDLSSRERQVLLAVAGGKLNKQVAAELGVSEVMVKVHRAKGMRKMQVTSLAELVRVIDQLSSASASEAGIESHFSAAGSRPAKRTRSRYADSDKALVASPCLLRN